jgi:hypothetical protein
MGETPGAVGEGLDSQLLDEVFECVQIDFAAVDTPHQIQREEQNGIAEGIRGGVRAQAGEDLRERGGIRARVPRLSESAGLRFGRLRVSRSIHRDQR